MDTSLRSRRKKVAKGVYRTGVAIFDEDEGLKVAELWTATTTTRFAVFQWHCETNASVVARDAAKKRESKRRYVRLQTRLEIRPRRFSSVLGRKGSVQTTRQMLPGSISNYSAESSPMMDLRRLPFVLSLAKGSRHANDDQANGFYCG